MVEPDDNIQRLYTALACVKIAWISRQGARPGPPVGHYQTAALRWSSEILEQEKAKWDQLR